MFQPTDLQQSIIDFAQESPDASSTEISDAVGCSPSYAREIKDRFLPAIMGEVDLFGLNVMVSFSFPHSVFLSDKLEEEIDDQDHRLVKLDLETNSGGISTDIAVVKNLDDLWELSRGTEISIIDSGSV